MKDFMHPKFLTVCMYTYTVYIYTYIYIYIYRVLHIPGGAGILSSTVSAQKEETKETYAICEQFVCLANGYATVFRTKYLSLGRKDPNS